METSGLQQDYNRVTVGKQQGYNRVEAGKPLGSLDLMTLVDNLLSLLTLASDPQVLRSVSCNDYHWIMGVNSLVGMGLDLAGKLESYA